MTTLNQKTKKSSALHYRLTHEEWLEAQRELKSSERDILYYLRTLDPFGDRPLHLGVRALAKTLRFNPSTVSRGLQTLHRKGYIDLEMVNIQVKINSKLGVLPPNNTVASAQHPRSQSNTLDPDATALISKQQSRSPGNTQALDPNQGMPSGSPHTIQTLKTDHTLSNSTDGEINCQNSKSSNEERLQVTGEKFQSTVQSDENQTDIVTDQNSAAPLELLKKSNSEPGILVSPLPPWRDSFQPNGLKPEFVEWIRKWLCSIPPERDRSKGDAIAYIHKQEKSGSLDTLTARAEEWLIHEEKKCQNAIQAQQVQQISEDTPRDELPDAEERTANYRRINQMIKQAKKQPTDPKLPMTEPEKFSELSSAPGCEALTEEILDCSDLLVRIQCSASRLHIPPEELKAWFIEKFGADRDRLLPEQLLDAVNQLDALLSES